MFFFFQPLFKLTVPSMDHIEEYLEKGNKLSYTLRTRNKEGYYSQVIIKVNIGEAGTRDRRPKMRTINGLSYGNATSSPIEAQSKLVEVFFELHEVFEFGLIVEVLLEESIERLIDGHSDFVGLPRNPVVAAFVNQYLTK